MNSTIQLTDEEEQELQAFEEQQYQMTLISDLGPSGFTETNDELHSFAGKVVAKAKETFRQKPILCRLWGFRHDGYEMLSCDLFSDDKSLRMPINQSRFNRGSHLCLIQYSIPPSRPHIKMRYAFLSRA
ncbi:hypothetical protein KB976_004609 [Vibrio parahaemolyticus]|nr:hypothetical protein [Vibrio parahaemolyticus]